MSIVKIVIRGAALLALTVAFVGAAAADNLLVNPGFEMGDLTGWLVYGAGPDASISVLAGDNGIGAPGTHCAFMDNHGQALNLTLKQLTDIGNAVPGPVDFAVDLKVGQVAVGGVFFVQIFAEQGGVGVIGQTPVLGPYSPADWTTITGTFTAPSGTDILTMQLSAVTGADPSSLSSMYVDNAVIDQGTVADEATSWSQVKALFQ